jgi:hypothetical protein
MEKVRHDKIHVVVSVASVKEPKEFDWSDDELVGTAADAAAKAFGITPEQLPTFQNERDHVLDRDKTLEAAGVKNGARLELVAGGGGVACQ